VSEDFRGIEEISIRNLGVIESAEIEFKPGLNVLTGETGAGKTMVLTALSLILGGKSDTDKVRTGAERLVASGRFAISDSLASSLEESGAEVESGSLLISRSVSADGKSRIHVGGAPTTAGKVAEIAEELVEVHAQSSTHRLTKPAYIRNSVDSFGGLQELVSRYSTLYSQYQELSERIEQLRSDYKNREREIAKLTEFMAAFKAVNPKVGELLEIEAELKRLSSVDELQQAVSQALNLFDGEDFSVSSALAGAKRALDHATGKDSQLDDIAESFGDALYGYQEVVGALHRYLSALDADPIRLEHLQERKSAINSLIKKFGEGTDREVAFVQMIERARESANRIADLEGGEDRIADLEKELQVIFDELSKAAHALSEERRATAGILQSRITSELRLLAMPHASVIVEVVSKSGSNISEYSASSLDDINLLFTSHEGAQPGQITKVASGGELSRVMLAIEVVLAAVHQVPTYIFDEVDSGVGGKAAIEVGRRLQLLAKDAQVIVVTHLAQVAVWADHHLVVRKSEGGSVSISDVVALSKSERSVEIARMLSGQEESAVAQEHARELLEMVRESVIS
jgi:DNA repair protein RecN (Recombination protein N)